MIPLDQARTHVLDRCPVGPVTTVALDEAVGLVLSSDVTSAEDVPPFANTAMDGFAVRAADTVGAPRELAVVGTLAAGAAPDVEVGPGQAVRIMTGAPMPPGADAVIMVELTERVGDERVRVTAEVPVGNHVRHAGEDVGAGAVVFEAGTVVTPAHVGVLASLGLYEVSAPARPRVGVISTGDELVESSAPLAPGQIRDSNRHTLLALLEASGTTGVDLGLIPDTEADIAAAIEHGVATCDALVSSGGVSMGDFDYVKVVLDRLGDMRWMQVAIKPAKPLAFGTVGDVPVFGLPGNPVSSMVSFELFAKPALRQMMGYADPGPVTVPGRAAEDLRRRPDGKTHFLRVQAHPAADGVLEVRSAGGQGSHQLTAMANGNALAVVPDGEGLAAGETVEVLRLTSAP